MEMLRNTSLDVTNTYYFIFGSIEVPLFLSDFNIRSETFGNALTHTVNVAFFKTVT